MSFRAKLLLACLPLALLPLLVFGLVAREEVTDRLGAQYEERVAALADVIERDLERESAAVAARLERLAEAMAADNRFRRAVLDREGADRAYLLDYAARAMPLAGLDLMRIQDEEGRVLSSGHFRHEYDALDPALPAALRRAEGGEGGGSDQREIDERGVLVALPTPTGPLLGLARARTVQLGPRTLTLVGGTAVDDRFLERLARGSGLEVELLTPADEGANERTGAEEPAAREVVVRFAGTGDETAGRFVVRASADPLVALRGEMDRWLVATLAGAAALALLLVIAVSSRLSRPLAELARTAGRVDLDRPDVRFPTRRGDEIGALARVLDRMTGRLRASAAGLREAERRATIGDIARQVNHDVRNGLIPIRNVVGHLAELARRRPAELPEVFLDRQGTLQASLEYLESLATNYARLSPRADPRPCDLNALARQVAADSAGSGDGDGRGDARVVTDLAPGLPPIHADPVALRRILQNLVVNALESLEKGDDRVVVWTRSERGSATVLFGVSDTGKGMTDGERARIFDDFYTTKREGGGLGLSIVRRLVSDLDGRIDVESEPGAGTRVTVELP